MSRLEMIKNQIEEQRKVLDQLTAEGNLEMVYSQSVKVDRLIEQYLDLAE